MKKYIYLFFLLTVFLVLSPLSADEGMLPLSELNKLDMKAIGFRIDSNELYNPNGVSLIDGIINLGGCTASFVSPDGLILTNYHCAFGAIQAETTTEKDYMKDGFFAPERSAEVPAKRYTVRLIDSYKDVSREVLSVVRKNMTHGQRTKAIEEKMNRIIVDVEKKNPGKRAEVAEMFRGKTYVLFIYNYIKDIRLVYAPPRSIGEYGGEEDNWMWPRHTGDFAFMRAYVAPDGSCAEYSPDNVPFHPKKYLKVAPDGVDTDDFAFILGYPARTYRHEPACLLAYEEDIRMPFIVDLFGWIIKLKEKMSESDRGTAIKLSSSLKGLWNTMKNYKGKLKSMKGIRLVEKRKEEEKALQKYIDGDPALKKKYGGLLDRFTAVYENKRKSARHNLILERLVDSRLTTIMGTAFTIYEASIERAKKDTERDKDYMDRNFDRTKQRRIMSLRNYYEPAEKAVFKELLMRAASLEDEYAIPAVRDIIKDGDPENAIDSFLQNAFNETTLKDPETVTALFDKTAAQLQKADDPFIVLARAVYPAYRKMNDAEKEEKGTLDPLLAQWVEVKEKYIGRDFIPDANSTLRLTYGKIRGYYPRDAVYMRPFTTLGGVVEKHISVNGKEPYNAPQKLIELCRARDYGRFEHPRLHDVPVAMLYNMDTTGGNSGSPVFNARGELIGLNFDRVFEATINDFAWDESYSRSIAVDIRYVLWFLEKFSGATHLLIEMGVEQ
jgi:hypothetical protein